MVVVVVVVCDRDRGRGHVWSWSWRGWTSCRCVDGLIGCVEGLLSGGASDRMVSSYEAERLNRRVVMVVVVAVVVVVVVVAVVVWQSWWWQSWWWQGLGGWTSCRWPLEWWCLDKRARIGHSNSKRMWRSGMGTDEVACK
jgi:hypothetical protein